MVSIRQESEVILGKICCLGENSPKRFEIKILIAEIEIG